MKQGQKSIGTNGKENVLFPLEHLNITQDSFGSFSHLGSWAIDLNKSSGVKERIYAPFSGKIVYVGSVTYAQFAIVSNDVVNHADGTTSKSAVLLVHSDNMPPNGASYTQGDYLCDTGNSGNSAGIHLHLEVNQTGVTQQIQNSSGTWCLSGQVDPAKSLYINDTTTGNIGQHNWVDYAGDVIIPEDSDDEEILTLFLLNQTRRKVY